MRPRPITACTTLHIVPVYMDGFSAVYWLNVSGFPSMSLAGHGLTASLRLCCLPAASPVWVARHCAVGANVSKTSPARTPLTTTPLSMSGKPCSVITRGVSFCTSPTTSGFADTKTASTPFAVKAYIYPSSVRCDMLNVLTPAFFATACALLSRSLASGILPKALALSPSSRTRGVPSYSGIAALRRS